MKAKYFLGVLFATLLSLGANAQERIEKEELRIAVFDFNAGAKVEQEDIDGISAMFNTFFEPEGYTIVERTRVSRILEEQHMQGSTITEERGVQIGKILNVRYIVIGDVNYVMKQYNVDVRLVEVETGVVVAKEGAEWSVGSSYRKMMKKIAERMSDKLKIKDPLYRSTGGSIRFTAGVPNVVASVAYNHYFTPSIMVGGGLGFGLGAYEQTETINSDGSIRDTRLYPVSAIPIYLEADFRTPRYKWSLFLNVKVGLFYYPTKLEDEDNITGYYHYSYSYKPFFVNFAAGVSYKNLNLGAGVTTINGINRDVPLSFFLSYNLPLSSISNGLF